MLEKELVGSDKPGAVLGVFIVDVRITSFFLQIKAMTRNPREVLKFIWDNLDPLMEISSARRTFKSADELEQPFKRFLDEGAHFKKRVSDMKQLGILIPATDQNWTMPAHVRDFLQRLQEHHTASAPGIVKAIISQMGEDINKLSVAIDRPDAPSAEHDAEIALKSSCELFYDAVDRLEQIRLAIEAEILKFRDSRNQREYKESCSALLALYERYLRPLVDVIDLNGSFVSTSNQLIRCCDRIIKDPGYSPSLNHLAIASHEAVWWQRQRTLRYADAMRHELEPLYQFALRESKLMRGINRIHAIFAQRQPDLSKVLRLVRVEDGKEATFFCDHSISLEFRRLQNYKPPLPPIIEQKPTTLLQLGPQYLQLLDELQSTNFVPDVIEWLKEKCGKFKASYVLTCLTRLYLEQPGSLSPTDVIRDYDFGTIVVHGHVWEWRMSSGNNN